MGLGFKEDGSEEEPESFRSALAVITDLRAQLKWAAEQQYKQTRALSDAFEATRKLSGGESSVLSERIEYIAARAVSPGLFYALRSADPQTLPEPIAKLVAAWKAGT